MNVLFTGGSGFIGVNVIPILSQRYNIDSVGLSDSDFYTIDLSKSRLDLAKKYDIVIHAAGKAHTMPKTKAEVKEFFDVNYGGTVNLCKSLERPFVPKSFIFISTVAVYGLEAGESIAEDYPLLGKSPYALSKIQAEKYLEKWCESNNVKLSIIRPALIAGPTPPGNLKELINGIRSGRYLSIAKGQAKKSMLMVEDIATLIPELVEKGGIYNLCADHHPTVRELEELISKQLGKNRPFSVPMWLARLLAFCGDILSALKFPAPMNSAKLTKLTQSLTFSNQKAKKTLNWAPKDVLCNFNNVDKISAR